MKIRIKHNTLMRLISGSILVIGLPGIVFLPMTFIFGWQIGLIGAVVVLLFIAYGFFFGWRHVVVRETTCTSALLPSSFDGYRILQLSDIHLGTYLKSRKFIDRLVDKVNAQKVDLIVFTGDLLNVSAEEVIPFQHALAKLNAKDGIYSVMGNHDYCEYVSLDKKSPSSEGRKDLVAKIAKNQNVLKYLEEKMGWHLLLNDHVEINREEDAIFLIGVENISRPPFQDYGDLKKAMDGLKEGTFKVLLSHDPSHWRRGVLHQTDIALTLSGHTHAGQVKIGNFSPSKWAYHEWGGKYTEGESMLNVSLGIGGTVPFRLGAWPEINVITLRKRGE